jgi:hypothetical protein
LGRSIDLYSYDYEKLVNKTLEVCKADSRELVEKILLSCGNKVGDRYIILNQELWEDFSCYYNVSTALERIFKIDDVFGKVFCSIKDSDTDKQILISAMELYEIESEIGIEIPDYKED